MGHQQFTVLFAALVLATGLPAYAGTILPSSLTVSVPEGSANSGATGLGQSLDGTRIFTDDVYLQELVFAETTFTRSGDNYSSAAALEVLSNRPAINVEWGDTDTDADGDDTPMTRIGQSNALKESTTPAIQDRALLEVFNSYSLTEMTDGEGPLHSYKVAFADAISDNDDGVDLTPEIVLFERGRNDRFELSLIIGGSFADPVLSEPLEILSSDFADVGLRVDTTEIGGPQSVGVGGYDLNDWDLEPGTEVYGFVYEGYGADLSGIFASGEADQFSAPLSDIAVVPLPSSLSFGLGFLVVLGAIRKRR